MLRRALIVSLIPAALAAAQGAWRIESTPAQTIEAVHSVKVWVAPNEGERTIVCAPKPPSLPSQVALSAALIPAGATMVEPGPLQRAYLRARMFGKEFDGRGMLVEYSATYRAALRSRRLVPAAPATRPAAEVLPTDQRGAYLAASATSYDFDQKVFQKWLDGEGLRKAPKEGAVEFGLRAFDCLRARLTYEADWNSDRHASAVARTLKSDCYGMSMLFVSILRANAVPARCLSGNSHADGRPRHPRRCCARAARDHSLAVENGAHARGCRRRTGRGSHGGLAGPHHRREFQVINDRMNP